MTKIITVETLKTLNRFNEHFPSANEETYSPLSTRRRFVSCPNSPKHFTRKLNNINLEDDSTGESGKNVHGQCSLQRSPLASKKIIINGVTGCDSRRSSGANSIPEVIEECDSDEETFNDGDQSYDYIRCINCSRSNSTNLLSITSSNKFTSEPHIPQQIINYCYKCRHLNHHPHLPAFYQGRRSSWAAGDNFSTPTQSPRNSRRSSLVTSSAVELPIISEPSFDDETNDTIELKLKVKEEVDKLTKSNIFKNSSRKPEEKARGELLIKRQKLRQDKMIDRIGLLMALRETNI